MRGMKETIRRLIFRLLGEPGPSQKPLAPHERWPEILHWREGDEFDYVNMGMGIVSEQLIAIHPDGVAYCWNSRYGSSGRERLRIPIAYLVGHNVSLRNRNIVAELGQTTEYMELIKQFNEAYIELQKRDAHQALGVAGNRGILDAEVVE